MNDTAPSPLRVGTRGSPLARTQAALVAAALQRAHPDEPPPRICIISSHGDRDRVTALDRFPRPGVFTRALERALAEGEIDLAAHSCKDLPARLAPGMMLAAVLPRGSAADALVVRSDGVPELAALPPGTRVGTGSIRRIACLRRRRNDLEIRPIRGNVESRLARLQAGEFDALILAAAGLERLRISGFAWRSLPLAEFPPAPGQGALACEIRSTHAAARARLARIDSRPDHAAVSAERAVLACLGAGCHAPLGVLARTRGDAELEIRAAVLAPDGSRRIDARRTGPLELAETLGRRVAADLLEHGAADLISQTRRTP